MSDDKKQDDKPKEIEHKIGLHNYARVGETTQNWIIVGTPNVRGKRWLTFSHKFGGPLVSYPESQALAYFWVPNPTES